MVLREVITDLILLDIATSFRQTHLYNLYRVLDLVVFSFANPSAKQETSLHVQCPVEITGPQGQLFSSELLDQPAPASGNHDLLPNAYDLALHPLPPEERTMADSALEAIHSTLPQAIRHVAASPDGRIVLTTDSGMTICISPIPLRKNNGESCKLLRASAPGISFSKMDASKRCKPRLGTKTGPPVIRWPWFSPSL